MTHEKSRWRTAKTIGGRVKGRREHLGLSQRALAKRVGVSQAHINRIEGDRSGISKPVVAQMAKALEVNEEWLETGTQPMAADVEPVSPEGRTRLLFDIYNRLEPETQALFMRYSDLMSKDRWALWHRIQRLEQIINAVTTRHGIDLEPDELLALKERLPWPPNQSDETE